jgi:hypothetical protein
MILRIYANRLWKAAVAMSKTTSSRDSSQAAASIALLAVVLARGLVQLADAMEAAGPQLLFEARRARPSFQLTWAPGGQHHMVELVNIPPYGDPAQNTENLQRQFWQLTVLQTVQPLLFGLRVTRGALTVKSAIKSGHHDYLLSCLPALSSPMH